MTGATEPNTDIEGTCSGDWVSGEITDNVIIPADLPTGDYVVGFRWDASAWSPAAAAAAGSPACPPAARPPLLLPCFPRAQPLPSCCPSGWCLAQGDRPDLAELCGRNHHCEVNGADVRADGASWHLIGTL